MRALLLFTMVASLWLAGCSEEENCYCKDAYEKCIRSGQPVEICKAKRTDCELSCYAAGDQPDA